jgi:hypothetical protein
LHLTFQRKISVKERTLRGEEDGITLHIDNTFEKEGEEGEGKGGKLVQGTLYACLELS